MDTVAAKYRDGLFLFTPGGRLLATWDWLLCATVCALLAAQDMLHLLLLRALLSRHLSPCLPVTV